MSAGQEARRAAVRKPLSQARGRGYLDGLHLVKSRRAMEPPEYRFAYDAGYRDGFAANPLNAD